MYRHYGPWTPLISISSLAVAIVMMITPVFVQAQNRTIASKDRPPAKAKRSPNGRVAIKSKPIGAVVHVDGQYQFIGRTPFVIPYRLYGRYRIKVNKKGFESIDSYYKFTGKRSTFSIRLKPKTSKKAFFRSMAFPGWGQYYSNKKLSGTIFLGASMASVVALAINEQAYSNQIATYQNTLNAINLQNGPAADSAQRQADALRKLNSKRGIRNTSAYIAAGIWVANMLESVLFFPDHAKDIEFFKKVGSRMVPGKESIKMVINYKF